MSPHKALPALLLALAVPVAWAQIYKWVDETGRVHYGEKPPPESKATTVKPPPARQSAPAQDRDVKAQEVEFRQRQIQKQESEAAQASEAAQRNALCNDARQRLALAEQTVLVRIEKGERAFLTDAEREAELARRRAAVTQYCR